jgi:hypothetical protein
LKSDVSRSTEAIVKVDGEKLKETRDLKGLYDYQRQILSFEQSFKPDPAVSNL